MNPITFCVSFFFFLAKRKWSGGGIRDYGLSTPDLVKQVLGFVQFALALWTLLIPVIHLFIIAAFCSRVLIPGYANILGAYYGDPKKDWQKKWIMIKNHQFSCHKKKGEDYEFAFSLKDVELGAPEQKIVKKGREGALKFHKGSETFIYLEVCTNTPRLGKSMLIPCTPCARFKNYLTHRECETKTGLQN